MESVSIRGLSGAVLRDSASQGKLLAITNHRALIGVAIPVTPAWADHLIDYNWSRVQQSIIEGERAVAAGQPGRPADEPPPVAARAAVPVRASLVAGDVVQSAETRELLQKIHEGFHPPGSGGEGKREPAGPSVSTVRIGDLSGHLIEHAGVAGQTLAVTDDRELVAIIIPVTKGLVQFLIDQTMSRVLDSIYQGEQHLDADPALRDQTRSAERGLSRQDVEHIEHRDTARPRRLAVQPTEFVGGQGPIHRGVGAEAERNG